jgi:hypothetical protein
VVARPEFDPRMVMSGAKCQHTFTLTAYASRAASELSEESLDALCELSGTGSLIAAVQDELNWTVTVDYAQVVRCGEVYVATFGGGTTEFLACSFDVEVVW